MHSRPAVPKRLWRRLLNLSAPALLSPRSSAAPCTADLDADAEANLPASHVFVVFEPVVSSCDLTLVHLAALPLLSLAAPQRLAPRFSTQTLKLDTVQLRRPRLHSDRQSRSRASEARRAEQAWRRSLNLAAPAFTPSPLHRALRCRSRRRRRSSPLLPSSSYSSPSCRTTT